MKVNESLKNMVKVEDDNAFRSILMVLLIRDKQDSLLFDRYYGEFRIQFIS